MTWKSLHNRGDVLRAVTAAADERRDGVLPMDVAGVAETFADELTLLGALQLRWHARLSARLERELMDEPMDLERAVVAAWVAVAHELPGTLAIVERHRAEPLDERMADAMRISATKERLMLAMMAGRVSAPDDVAVRVGAEIEERARLALAASPMPSIEDRDDSILGRLRAALAAA